MFPHKNLIFFNTFNICFRDEHDLTTILNGNKKTRASSLIASFTTLNDYEKETARRIEVAHVKSYLGLHRTAHRQDGYILMISGIKAPTRDHNWTDSIPGTTLPVPDRDLEVEIKLTSTTTSAFYFTIVPKNLPDPFHPDYPNGSGKGHGPKGQ